MCSKLSTLISHDSVTDQDDQLFVSGTCGKSPATLAYNRFRRVLKSLTRYSSSGLVPRRSSVDVAKMNISATTFAPACTILIGRKRAAENTRRTYANRAETTKGSACLHVICKGFQLPKFRAYMRSASENAILSIPNPLHYLRCYVHLRLVRIRKYCLQLWL